MSLIVQPVENPGDVPGSFINSERFLQTPFWAGVKKQYGWKPFTFIVNNGQTEEFLLVLIRFFKGKALAYVPHGPSEEFLNNTTLKDLSTCLKPFLPSCLFIRWDLITGTTGANNFPDKLRWPLQASPASVQPPDTVILDVTQAEEELLAGMHKKTRYNIRLAAKKGVVVRQGGTEDLEPWYELYKTTAERDKIALHSLEYYKTVFHEAVDSEEVDMKLYLAEHEGELLAGIWVLYHGSRATYLYGASSDSKRNLMPAYALQWQAIREASEAGIESYDFFGIPPVNDKKHPMYGLYRFKTGFGGVIHHRHGCWDYPLKKVFYLAFCILEKMRNIYYKKLRKR